jgi:hypothetical protein
MNGVPIQAQFSDKSRQASPSPRGANFKERLMSKWQIFWDGFYRGYLMALVFAAVGGLAYLIIF